jgi:ATP-binding cassette subfamily B protein
MAYRNRIELTDVSFRYGTKAPWILSNISLTIEKGSRVGLIGATGTGKSTLVDVIMGLLQPNAGTITVDGKPITSKNLRQWQGCIAHVPQSIFLADSTIEDNIAFGQSPTTIDRSRVRLAAEQAQIHEVIQSLPQGYQTLVGERGVRLSGGQRQRIGIARALYKRAQIIVFDEATSALDEKTESSVISAIEKLHPDLTILMIAHRISTLKNCSKIIELGHQGAQEIGNYRDLAEREAPQNQVIPIRTSDSQGADSVASDSGFAVTIARNTLNNSATS